MQSPGIEFCKQYFGFTDADVAFIASVEGVRKLMYLWEAGRVYDSPWDLLRQEVWQSEDPRGIRQIVPTARNDRLRLAKIEPPSLVDVGCGGAEYLRPHIESGQHVHLVDASPMIREYLGAKWRAFDNVRIYDDGDSILADYLICIDVLEHVRDPIGLTLKIRNWVRRGGGAVFYFAREWPHPGHLLESIDQYELWKKVLKKHFDIMTEDDGHFVTVRRS